MVYLDVLIQLYSCVQWHFNQAMTRGGRCNRKNYRGVTTDLGARISKNVTNVGSQLSFPMFTLEKNYNFQSRRQIMTAREVYGTVLIGPKSAAHFR